MLDLQVRLRTVGFWPWIGLVLWACAARLGEAADVFRPFGIFLTLHGVWFGGTILLASLVLAGSTQPRAPYIRFSEYAAGTLVVLVGLAQALLCLTMDLVVPADPEFGSYLTSFWTFVVVWLPSAVAWSPASPTAALAARAVPWMAFACSACMAVPAWREVPWRSISASALATVTVLCFRVSARSWTPYLAGTRPAGVQA